MEWYHRKGNTDVALNIGIASNVIKTGALYGYEHLWDKENNVVKKGNLLRRSAAVSEVGLTRLVILLFCIYHDEPIHSPHE